MKAPPLAWITGASSGIGKATAIALAAKGWTVAASARDPQKLALLPAQCGLQKDRVRLFPVDVTDGPSVAQAARRIEREIGPIDLAFLNAGTHRPTPVTEFSADKLRSLLEVNVLGVAHGLEAVLPGMIQRRSGRVMIVASLAGYSGLPTASAYGATKAALINMAEALRPELMELGVTVQLVNPGFVRTPLTDRNAFHMPFLIEAEAAADIIVKALESDRFEIAFPWAFASLLKVARILPYSLYFRLVRRLAFS